MSPSEGRRFGVSVRVSDPVIGSQFRSMSMSWAYSRYFENPWVQHHVLALHYAGGLSGGDLGRRGIFAVGGFPEVSLQDMVLDQVVLGGQALRGYAPFDRRGTRFQLAQLEYRFPIVRIQRGPVTLPVYLNRLHAAVFADVGDAYFGKLRPKRLRVGVGAELYLDFTTGYFLPFTLRMGFAYGVHERGGPQFYFHLGRPF